MTPAKQCIICGEPIPLNGSHYGSRKLCGSRKCDDARRAQVVKRYEATPKRFRSRRVMKTCPWCEARLHDGRQVTCGADECRRKQKTHMENKRRSEGMSREVVQFVPANEAVKPWEESMRDPIFAKLDAALGHNKWRGQADPNIGDVSRAKSALAEIGRSL